QTVGCMQVFGLRCVGSNEIPYRTLDEALAEKTLEITETSEGGTVPLLKLLNRGDEAVFLMAGEQLVGAKQNRILNASILAAARGELTIPVSCVEAGRWHYSSPKFGSPGTMAHGKLRGLMSKHVRASAGRGAGYVSDQCEVWSEGSRKQHRLESFSATRALQQTYVDFHARLDAQLGDLHVAPECSGCVFAIAGRITGMDLFDKAATLAKLWPKLTRAYALDAFEEKGTPVQSVTRDAGRSWLDSLVEVTSHVGKTPGLRHYVSLGNDKIVGSCLVVEERPIHAELFTLYANAA